MKMITAILLGVMLNPLSGFARGYLYKRNLDRMSARGGCRVAALHLATDDQWDAAGWNLETANLKALLSAHQKLSFYLLGITESHWSKDRNALVSVAFDRSS
ncbi:MAG: hypothetical protein K2X47_06995, partial [Bdellovibrionales bacterium]|nr:hypothetical protein [Bdellovibrionales bacterium]